MTSTKSAKTDSETNKEIQIFREYLRIPSVQPNVDYEPCLEFLKRQATDLGLTSATHYPAHPKKPIFIMTWTGTEPNLPSIILNSHMDVVPVFEEHWTHPPFSAHMDDEGKIYARGSQDMKCVGMQYLAAIRSLQNDGIKLKRTIHVMFVPDEEIGGKLGMREFVHTKEFQALNAGFSLDEGYASTNDTFHVFYAERSIWHIYFHIAGTPGHGSLLLPKTVGSKLHYLIDRMYEWREHEVNKLTNNPDFTIGNVTSINLTEIKGGVQSNVIPPLFVVCFDVRIAIDIDHEEVFNKLKKWCDEAGGDIEITFGQKEPKVQATKIDSTNPFWLAFESSIKECGLKIKTQIFPGGTDSRFIRDVGIPAIGFSPMNNTPVLLHDHNEYLKADTYLEGIEIYKKIIPKVANA